MSFQRFLDGFEMKKAEEVVVDADQTYPTTIVIETVEDVPKSEDIHIPVEAGKVSARNILQHPDAHPIALDLIMLQKYGPEFLEWDPETLPVRVPQDFPGQTLSHLNAVKLQACKTIHLVDTFWQQWEIFLWCSMALTGTFPNFEVMQVPTAAQVLLAVASSNRIRHDVEWSGEVRGYLETVFLHDGVFCPPEPLDFLQLNHAEYGIDCGAVQAAIAKRKETGELPADEQLREQVRRQAVLVDALKQDQHELNTQLKLVSHVV